jgi:hypothetical protein
MRTRQRSRKLGLTTEEWYEHHGEGMHDPDFWKLVAETSDPVRYVTDLIEEAQQLAEQVLRDAGLPSTAPEALFLNPDKIPPNAELARRIVSNIVAEVATRNALGSQQSALLFIAGFELASWERQLFTNLEYEPTVASEERKRAALPAARAASVAVRTKTTLANLKATATLKPQKKRAAVLGVTVSALKKALAKQK